MSDYSPPAGNGNKPFTRTAGAAVTGGQLCYASGDGQVTPTPDTTRAAVGIVGHDAPSGARVTIWPLPNLIHESVNSNAGSLVAGDAVVAGANGGVDFPAGVDSPTRRAAAAAAGTMIGICTKGGATGTKVQWMGT